MIPAILGKTSQFPQECKSKLNITPVFTTRDNIAEMWPVN